MAAVQGIKFAAAVTRDQGVFAAAQAADAAALAAAIIRESAALAAAIVREALKAPVAGQDETPPAIPRTAGQEWYQPSVGVNWTWIISGGTGAWVEFAGRASLATQAKAIAGTDNYDTMTALRVAQAIAALAPAGGEPQPFVTLTDAATITLAADADFSIQNAKVTLGGNRTLAITGLVSGMAGALEVIQDGTGSRTLTLPVNSRVSGGGAGSITLTATAGAVDKLAWCYDGTYLYWDAPKLNYTASGTPVITSAVIGASGTTLTLNGSLPLQNGAGGSVGVTLDSTGAAVTATYASGSGTSALVYTLSRTVLNVATEQLTWSYAQPGNGIEAVTGGTDLAPVTDATVTNDSTQTSGGAPEWVDAFDPSLESTVTPTPDYRKRQPLVASKSGNCTKLRFYSGDLVFGLDLKMALYDASLNQISTGSQVFVSTNEVWTEYPISSVPVTSGATYHVGFVGQNGTGARVRTKAVEPTGRTDYSDGAFTLPTDFSAGSDDGFQFAVGMYIEP